MERRTELRNKTKKGFEAVQGKVLRQKLTESKFSQLVASRRASGMFYEDEDFPGDEDEP